MELRGAGCRAGRFIHLYDASVRDPSSEAEWLAVTDEPLDVARALSWATGPNWGALTSFVGLVRDNAGERTEVSAIDYEAYEEQVVPGFARLAATARQRWPELGRLVIWHRTGLVALEEASVVVVVSAPHRDEALEACRYLIDTLKATAPIWKREHWPGGSDWSPESRELAR